ncbi:MAG TPA: inositol monophosphatase family protein [Patescibacteria group bacterium]|nr:inositol monophosphatase family protein [Patescibacteria group bacterium]
MISPELKACLNLLRQTNKLLKKRFSENAARSISFKSHKEIVTPTDIEVNQFITKKLLASFPDDDIVSEEAEFIDRPGSRRWHLDPLDGTTNFAYGLPLFATCLGLENKSGIFLGAIGLPLTDEIYYAEKGRGGFLNGKRISVSKTKEIKAALMLICRGHSPAGKKRFKCLLKKFNLGAGRWRILSSAGIELAAVASGKADACLLSNVNSWDVAAGVILIREAGGRVTNFQGKHWQVGDNTLLASNGRIHHAIITKTKNIY